MKLASTSCSLPQVSVSATIPVPKVGCPRAPANLALSALLPVSSGPGQARRLSALSQGGLLPCTEVPCGQALAPSQPWEGSWDTGTEDPSCGVGGSLAFSKKSQGCVLIEHLLCACSASCLSISRPTFKVTWRNPKPYPHPPPPRGSCPSQALSSSRGFNEEFGGVGMPQVRHMWGGIDLGSAENREAQRARRALPRRGCLW
jgi:hypothetical protein